ncbi:MAG: hypothetical protein H3C30_18470 [Candidatus Hydrogenedentes bacterium]|nr:hypothetical protein [Candidatus Hydrogenedentota bacterium]
MGQIALATEDELSETVGCRLIEEYTPHHNVGLKLRRDGSGYLRANLKKLSELSVHIPVLLITDLDQTKCPSLLLNDWAGRMRLGKNLLLRVAVREIESWLLADQEAMRSLFAANTAKIPNEPDTISDPKRFLLNLARKAPAKIRNELVADEGSTARQGLGYNAVLCDFVRKEWAPDRAAKRSTSLYRTIHRLRRLADEH